MAEIIEKHDNDKTYMFTCPTCGTKFTERERKLHRGINFVGDYIGPDMYEITCPNCEKTNFYSNYEEIKDE